MSKSNLKNMNTLSLSKKNYIFYTSSTYSNLLYRLQKSSNWALGNMHFNSVFLQNSHKDAIMKYMVSLKWRYGFSLLLKRNFTTYNPNSWYNLNNQIELTFKKKYYHLDHEMLQKILMHEKKQNKKLGLLNV